MSLSAFLTARFLVQRYRSFNFKRRRFHFCRPPPTNNLTNRVYAIYQILLGWKTYKYYYETEELPNPRPTQPKTN